MSNLKDEAQSLFDAARAGYEPNQADKQRVLSGLTRAGVIGAVTSLSARAAAQAPGANLAAASSVKALALKAGLWLAIGGSVGIGGYALSRALPHRADNASASAPAGTVGPSNTSRAVPPLQSPEVKTGAVDNRSAPASLERSASPKTPGPSLPRPSSAIEDSRTRSRVSSLSTRENSESPQATEGDQPSRAATWPEGSAEPPRSVARDPSALGVEARALAQVQRALKEGRSAEALALVEAQQRQFAGGALQPERSVAKIVALCAVGRVADAQSAAQIFLANSPRSPFAARIRASCAGP